MGRKRNETTRRPDSTLRIYPTENDVLEYIGSVQYATYATLKSKFGNDTNYFRPILNTLIEEGRIEKQRLSTVYGYVYKIKKPKQKP